MLRITLFLALFSSSVMANQYWESVFQQTEEARLRAQKIQQPIDAPKSSSFGLRFHPILNIDKLHRGVDFAAAEGTPFNAAGSGVVLYAEERGDLGITIAIEHANGYITRYGHASKSLVMPGDIVDKQTQIGLVGSTGVATAPHIHFELIIDGEHVDPSEITSFYNPNEELSTLDERIDALFSSQQKSTLDSLASNSTTDENPTNPPVPLNANLALAPSSSLQDEAQPIFTDVQHEHKLLTDSTNAGTSNLDSTQAPIHEHLPKTTWGIAERLISGTDLTIFQALYALVIENPKAFKDGNMHFRYADIPLVMPSLEKISAQSHEQGRALYYQSLSQPLNSVTEVASH